MKKTRIDLGDTTFSALTKMSDGNPGAITCLMSIVKDGGKIDPDSALGGLGAVLSLDSMGIYGTDIYVLWSDICDRDTVKMLAVLRAVQLGLFSETIVQQASHRQDRIGKKMIPVDSLLNQVKEMLPSFGIDQPYPAGL